jgi:arginine decarboxylase
MEHWNVAKSLELYRIQDWGMNYFGINEKGHVTVSPTPGGPSCDLYELMSSLQQRGIEAPVLIRFDGIIQDRTKQIQLAFEDAMQQWGFKGKYRITYPLKVNPQGHVVETIRKSGFTRNIGLEVGSKPELLAVLALHDLPDSVLLCNGYKDQEYIELALLGRKLGRRSIIIIEQLYELRQVLDIAESLGVEAELGLRMKPGTRSGGLWNASSGDQAKFGLNSHQVLSAIETLNQHGKSHWLKLLHFHVGSQIPAINSFRRVLKEAARMYVEVAKAVPSLTILDIGGGLGVDYDGSKSNFESSMNYTVNEYAEAVVSAVCDACDKAEIAHPDIVSESGRALVAHHSILVAEVLDVAPALMAPQLFRAKPSTHDLIEKFIEVHDNLTLKNLNESLNEALSLKEEILDSFIQGSFSLNERAYAEHVFRQITAKLLTLSKDLKHIPEELEKLSETLRDTYFCNFSLFQSMLDSWAIDQLFPIMPIQNLDQEPTTRAILADLTCDSDGEISRFIDLKDVKNYLPCHSLRDDAPYFIGIFLVGAYQEILGGLHNLFGDTNAVHVSVGENGEGEIEELVRGDTIRTVLDYVEYDVPNLVNRFRIAVENAIKNGLPINESANIQRRYREALEGYTYLVK